MSTLGKHPTHPIYPRPVSPLHYEPLYTRPEDVLWEQDSTEERSDNDEGVRAAKRRRIEKAGEAYLRGEGLFILTAGIRGPLGEGWVNPWKKKKRRKVELGGERLDVARKAEVPETVERRKSQKEDDRGKEALQKENPMAEAVVNDVIEEQSIRPATQVEDARRLLVQHDPFIANATSLNGRGTPEGSHREAWLKKGHIALAANHDFYTEDGRQQQGSPSSRIRQTRPAGRNTSIQAEQERPSKSEIGGGGSSDGRAETLIKLLRRRGNVVKSPISPQRQKGVQADQLQNAPQGEDGSASARQPQSPPNSFPKDSDQNHTTTQTHSLADGIFEQRLPSPPAEGSPVEQNTVQDGHPPSVEKSLPIVLQAADQDDSVLSAAKPRVTNQDGANSKQHREIQDPTDAPHAHSTMPPPALSTDTSSATVVSTMPSAQVAPTAQAPPPSESLPSTGDKLSEQDYDHSHQHKETSSYLSTPAAIAAAQLQLQNELTTPQALTMPASAAVNINPSTTKPKSKSGITPFSAFNNPNPNHVSITTNDSLNTQEMLDAVTPFNLTTTIKKVPLTTVPPDSESPTLAAHQVVKKKTQKVRKRASFAPDAAFTGRSNSGSSQGSIKASLKVCKHGDADKAAVVAAENVDPGRVLGESTGPSVSEFGKLGLDMETSFEIEEESPAGGTGKDMSAVSKPTNGTSSKTTSEKQDAQKVTPRPIIYHHDNTENEPTNHSAIVTDGFVAGKGLEPGYGKDKDGVENGNGDEDFDLSAAMDEVGGFLQSWDTEREVREIKTKEGTVRRKGTGTVDKGEGQGQGQGTGGLRASLRELRDRSRR